MRKCLLLFSFISFSAISFAQSDNDIVYFFKEDWSPAKNYDDAFYFMHLIKENDTTYIGRSYTKTGPMVRWETFKDKGIDMPHGRFAYYNSKKGTIDSSGFVYEGKKDSTWYYSDANGKTIIREDFKRGKLVKRTNYLTNKITNADGSEEDIKTPEVKKDTSLKKDSVSVTVVQTPAEYKGGISSWNQFLAKNLKTPERFINLQKSAFKGIVIVNFIIDKDGNLGNIFIEKSCEWSTDTEAIRVLKLSPKWKPAVQNGRNVIYRHRQSINFQVNEQ